MYVKHSFCCYHLSICACINSQHEVWKFVQNKATKQYFLTAYKDANMLDFHFVQFKFTLSSCTVYLKVIPLKTNVKLWSEVLLSINPVAKLKTGQWEVMHQSNPNFFIHSSLSNSSKVHRVIFVKPVIVILNEKQKNKQLFKKKISFMCFYWLQLNSHVVCLFPFWRLVMPPF